MSLRQRWKVLSNLEKRLPAIWRRTIPCTTLPISPHLPIILLSPICPPPRSVVDLFKRGLLSPACVSQSRTQFPTVGKNHRSPHGRSRVKDWQESVHHSLGPTNLETTTLTDRARQIPCENNNGFLWILRALLVTEEQRASRAGTGCDHLKAVVTCSLALISEPSRFEFRVDFWSPRWISGAVGGCDLQE